MMKNLIEEFSKIRKIISGKKLFLMLDFDGTLCPLARTPSKAKIPARSKMLLQKLARKMPVAVISGRSLNDIKKKVGVRGLIYAGNHGLEWEISRKKGGVFIPKNRGELKTAKRKIKVFLKKHPGSFIEDKGIILAVHFRNIASDKEKPFKENIKRFLKNFSSAKSLILSEGKKVFELRPAVKWNKGNFAAKILEMHQRKSGKKLLPVCIGDDNTDEDIFKRFKRAITVRVGKNKTSGAGYYLSSSSQVGNFLKNLLVFTQVP